MAKQVASWGIDIGQCALKALRCRPDPEDPQKIIADAFDYIEYPRILSQPEADPAALIREALQLFLSRNSVRGDRVAISVSGSSGLARFIKLPPVETKKIPDIVRYEANQQIPFDLKDVIWDYQRMYGGSEEEGFALETEVGLFAMKRDQVIQALEPFRAAGIPVDVVQLTPLALYNFLVFDRLGNLPNESDFDPESPPESVMALSLGTETTDLVISNGYRVWQRNIPIGGSHFTKALTKELKLTYAKAEHLKRNATQAEDPKAVYQAMRPVFKDLLTEVQRSVGFFNSLDKTAKIGSVVALGNSMKLPGLKRYLSQNLGFEVAEIESFTALTGPAVIAAPAFKNNLLCFGVAYGLALQGLDLGRLATNLVPQEVVRDRIIRAKKPWVLAATLLLAFGALTGFLLQWWPWSKIRVNDSHNWKEASAELKRVDTESNDSHDKLEKERKSFETLKGQAEDLAAQMDRRLEWADMMLAVNQCLPAVPPEKEPEDLAEREQLHILDFQVQHFDDLSRWTTPYVRNMYMQNRRAVAGIPARPAASPPTGAGYVVQLHGYHLHNAKPGDSGGEFVRRTLLDNLEAKAIRVFGTDGKYTLEVKPRDIGITYPILFSETPQAPVELPNPRVLADPTHPERKPPDPNAPPTVTLNKYEFIVQFAWVPHAPAARAAGRLVQWMAPEQNVLAASGDK
ncbi:MAG: pilus assembly protein PilM [Planctomycetia bacterium]|nr:pilus assembly protein PilM [Planctomycetia bacterium]